MTGRHCDGRVSRRIGQACLICGRTKPIQLAQHSIASMAITLCTQCDHDLKERSLPPPSAIWTPPDNLELIAQALLAEADLLSLLAQSRWIFAHALLDRVRREAPSDRDETP